MIYAFKECTPIKTGQDGKGLANSKLLQPSTVKIKFIRIIRLYFFNKMQNQFPFKT